eukprot:5772049-Pleurochrysis_carterae.AAC.1
MVRWHKRTSIHHAFIGLYKNYDLRALGQVRQDAGAVSIVRSVIAAPKETVGGTMLLSWLLNHKVGVDWKAIKKNER